MVLSPLRWLLGFVAPVLLPAAVAYGAACLLPLPWPAADPQHTWIGIVAAGEVTAAARTPVLLQLDRLLAARNPEDADHPGSWEPAAGCDRAETTAWHLLTLDRANRLLVQDARTAPPAATPR
jgi:hypothetical protein